MNEFKHIWKEGVDSLKRSYEDKPTLYTLIAGGYRYEIGDKSRALTGNETVEEVAKITQEMLK